jgi:hypothetical protein
MTYPDLTREQFLVLAEQAGFDPADPHLDELYPDVRLMFERVAVLDRAELGDSVEPGGPGAGSA